MKSFADYKENTKKSKLQETSNTNPISGKEHISKIVSKNSNHSSQKKLAHLLLSIADIILALMLFLPVFAVYYNYRRFSKPNTSLSNTTIIPKKTIRSVTSTTIPNTTLSVSQKQTVTDDYDYNKLSQKYRGRTLYVACTPQIIRSHAYLDPLLKDLESTDKDKKVNALLKIDADSGYASPELINRMRKDSQTNSNSTIFTSADNLANLLQLYYIFENTKDLTASGFLLTNNVFLTANHLNTGIIALYQQYLQTEDKLLSLPTVASNDSNKKFVDFLFYFQPLCYVQPLNSLQKYPIKLPFTELGSDAAIGYLEQSIPTDNLQSFSFCKDSPKIGNYVYTASYPGGEFLESFGEVLNKMSKLKLTTGNTVIGDIYLTNLRTIPGSSGGGTIMYTNLDDCLFGVNFAGNLSNQLYSGKTKAFSTSILPYMGKINTILQVNQ